MPMHNLLATVNDKDDIINCYTRLGNICGQNDLWKQPINIK